MTFPKLTLADFILYTAVCALMFPRAEEYFRSMSEKEIAVSSLYLGAAVYAGLVTGWVNWFCEKVSVVEGPMSFTAKTFATAIYTFFTWPVGLLAATTAIDLEPLGLLFLPFAVMCYVFTFEIVSLPRPEG